MDGYINENKEVAFAQWTYITGQLVVHIMYALPNETQERLKLAWNPKLGCKTFFLDEYV